MLACRLRRVEPELLNIEQTFINYKARRIYGFSFLTFNDPRVVHVARFASPPSLSRSPSARARARSYSAIRTRRVVRIRLEVSLKRPWREQQVDKTTIMC